MRPRIAIPVPTSSNLHYNRQNWSVFAECVRTSGGEPIEFCLDCSPRLTAELASTCQAILLPGSPADVTPGKYGQEKHEHTATADPARENVDELLLQDAHNLYKPIFGVCFGAQMLNVWRSGTLLQDLPILPVNHAAVPSVAIAHTVDIRASLLARILLNTDAETTPEGLRLRVNSSHHQAVDVLGDSLTASARCPQDGTIEAFEGRVGRAGASTLTPSSHFVLGVQWHPERSYSSSAASCSLFNHFIAFAAAWRPRRVTTSVAQP